MKFITTTASLAILSTCAAATAYPVLTKDSTESVQVGEPFVLHTIAEDGNLWPVYLRYKLSDDAKSLGLTGFLQATKDGTDFSTYEGNDTAPLVSDVPVKLRYDANALHLEILNPAELVPQVLTADMNLCLRMSDDQNDYTIGSCTEAFASNFDREFNTTTSEVKYTQRMTYEEIPIKRCMSFRAESYYNYERTYQSVNPNCINNTWAANKFWFKEIDATLYEEGTTDVPSTTEVPTEAPNMYSKTTEASVDTLDQAQEKKDNAVVAQTTASNSKANYKGALKKEDYTAKQEKSTEKSPITLPRSTDSANKGAYTAVKKQNLKC